MGKLEKVGALVVCILLCIIVAVGVLNHGNRPDDTSVRGGQREAEQAALHRESDGKTADLTGRRKGPRKNFKTLDELARDLKKRRSRSKPPTKKPRTQAGPGNSPGRGQAKPKDGSDAGGAKNKPDPRKDVPVKPTPRGEWPKTHVVKSGDLLGSICLKTYGTTRMLKAVMRANPGLDPRRMVPGKTKITLPAPDPKLVRRAGEKVVAETAGSPAALRRPSFITSNYLASHGASAKTGGDKVVAKGYYVVRRNDTLSSIAQKQLGSVRYVEALLKANRKLIKDPNRLKLGWKLKLPDVN